MPWTRTEELAWAAGLFDGEGSTSASDRWSTPHLRVPQSGQAEPEVLMRFLAIVGVGSIKGPRIQTPSSAVLVLRSGRTESGRGPRTHLAMARTGEAKTGRSGSVQLPNPPNAWSADRAIDGPAVRGAETAKFAIGRSFMRAGAALRRNALGQALAPGIPIGQSDQIA